MLGLFATKKQPTYYDREKEKQARERLERSKLRLATCARLLREGETLYPVEVALEMHDLIEYIEPRESKCVIDCGLILSDCDTLRVNKKLGENKYTIETTNEGWN